MIPRRNKQTNDGRKKENRKNPLIPMHHFVMLSHLSLIALGLLRPLLELMAIRTSQCNEYSLQEITILHSKDLLLMRHQWKLTFKLERNT